jgi:hypothetical protein
MLRSYWNEYPNADLYQFFCHYTQRLLPNIWAKKNQNRIILSFMIVLTLIWKVFFQANFWFVLLSSIGILHSLLRSFHLNDQLGYISMYEAYLLVLIKLPKGFIRYDMTKLVKLPSLQVMEMKSQSYKSIKPLNTKPKPEKWPSRSFQSF